MTSGIGAIVTSVCRWEQCPEGCSKLPRLVLLYMALEISAISIAAVGKQMWRDRDGEAEVGRQR